MICIELSKNNTNDEIVTILHPIKMLPYGYCGVNSITKKLTGQSQEGTLYAYMYIVHCTAYWCWHDAILWLNLQNTTLGIYYDSFQPAKSNSEPQSQSKCPSKLIPQSHGIDLILSRSSKIRFFCLILSQKVGENHRTCITSAIHHGDEVLCIMYRVNFLHWHSTVTVQLTSFTQTRLNTKYIINIPIFRAVCYCVKEFTVKRVIRPHITCLIRVIRKNIN